MNPAAPIFTSGEAYAAGLSIGLMVGGYPVGYTAFVGGVESAKYVIEAGPNASPSEATQQAGAGVITQFFSNLFGG